MKITIEKCPVHEPSVCEKKVTIEIHKDDIVKDRREDFEKLTNTKNIDKEQLMRFFIHLELFAMQSSQLEVVRKD